MKLETARPHVCKMTTGYVYVSKVLSEATTRLGVNYTKSNVLQLLLNYLYYYYVDRWDQCNILYYDYLQVILPLLLPL